MTASILWMGGWIAAPIVILTLLGNLLAMAALEEWRTPWQCNWIVLAIAACLSVTCHAAALWLAFAAGFLA